MCIRHSYRSAAERQAAPTARKPGRRALPRFTFDLAWPLVYTFFLVTAVSWVFGKAFAAHSPWQMANLAPVLGMLFDFLENISTSLVMLRYPQGTPVLDSLAAVFTALKWVLFAASFVLLLLGGILAIRKKLFPPKIPR